MPMTPMGLLKIGAYFKDQGCKVKLIDCGPAPSYVYGKSPYNSVYKDAPLYDVRESGSSESDKILKGVYYYGKSSSWIRNQIIAYGRPDQIWIGTHLTYYYETVWDLVRVCKEIYPKTPVLIGGIYPTLDTEHAKRSGADIVFNGDIEGLESYMPDYSLLEYQTPVKMFKSSSGCKVNPPCAFCSVPKLNPVFRPMDVDTTVSWIEKEFRAGTRSFIMWSSQLLMPPRTFKEFCEKIISLGLPDKGLMLSASEGIQPSLFKEDVAYLMRKAGFQDVNIPLEAIRDSRIEEYQKPSSLIDIERSINLSFKNGFRTIKAFIMMGTPGQEADEIIEAIVYCWKHMIKPTLMPFTPVPKSQMYEESDEFKTKNLELLNPYLWPAASKKLSCNDLELIKYYTFLGFDDFISNKKLDRKISGIFLRYIKEYNLLKDRSYYLVEAS